MTYPASTQTLSDSLANVNRVAINAKNIAQSIRDSSVSGPIRRQRLINLMQTLTVAIDTWAVVSSTPGIVEYARIQFNDPGMDVAAEFTAMRSAAIALRLWIFNNFPKTGNAFLLSEFDLNGNETSLIFTSVQLTDFRTEADAFIATVG